MAINLKEHFEKVWSYELQEWWYQRYLEGSKISRLSDNPLVQKICNEILSDICLNPPKTAFEFYLQITSRAQRHVQQFFSRIYPFELWIDSKSNTGYFGIWQDKATVSIGTANEYWIGLKLDNFIVWGHEIGHALALPEDIWQIVDRREAKNSKAKSLKETMEEAIKPISEEQLYGEHLADEISIYFLQKAMELYPEDERPIRIEEIIGKKNERFIIFNFGK